MSFPRIINQTAKSRLSALGAFGECGCEVVVERLEVGNREAAVRGRPCGQQRADDDFVKLGTRNAGDYSIIVDRWRHSGIVPVVESVLYLILARSQERFAYF